MNRKSADAISLDRRIFLKAGTASGLMALAPFAQSAPLHTRSEAFRMVAKVDRQRILNAADRYVSEKPVTITAFPAKLSAGGIHDFFSQADYFWPNPKDPTGPYINRDGQSNPDNFDDHRRVMVSLSMQVPALTAAWLLTGHRPYGQRAAEHLLSWFVAPETRMNPNLQYAQAVIGVSTGRNYGIIDTLHLVEVARAASLLNHEVIRPDDAAAVRQWFREYLDWLLNSERGKAERDTLNNHAVTWALQAAEFARLAGDQGTRQEIYRRYREILLPNQMAPDGSFPRELTRTKPYSYSIFNFDSMAELCQSLQGLSPEPLSFQLPDGRGVARGAEFLFPYLKDKSAWKWTHDVQHFDALPVRSPGLLFAGIAFRKQEYLDLWKKMNPDPTDKEIIRNNAIRQPLLWV